MQEELLRALVEAGPDALIVCDDEGRIVLANQQAERLFGHAAGELRGQPVEVLLPERHRGAHEAHRARFAASPATRPMGSGRALTGRRKDGTEFPAEVSLSPVRADGARFVAAAVRDVTDHRKLAEALAAAERRLRELVEQAPDGIFIADLTGRYTSVNSAACRMLGYARDELVGLTIADLIPEEDLSRLAGQRDQLSAARGSALVGEWTLRRKDGRYLPVEVSATILEDGRWQAIVRDVSERRRLEREAAAAIESLRAVLSHCPVGIALSSVREDGVLIELNDRAKALLQRPDERVRLGDHLPLLTHLDGRSLTSAESPSYRTLQGEHVPPMELLLRRPDGTRIPIQARGAPLYDSDGVVTGGVVAFEDISAEKDLDRLRSEWNAIVAHDLRNPLNVIVLHAELLSRTRAKTGLAAESIEEIQSAAAELNRMIQDLLDLSRLEAKKLSLRRDPTKLVAVLRKAIDRATLAAPDRVVELRVTGEVPPVLVDRDRLAQVVDNLLGNAVKYGDPNTAIDVIVEAAGDMVSVGVRNRGAGLRPEAVAQLFQRFHRTVEGRLAHVEGVGLGLYIVRELVEAHGGEIWVESVPDGETTFHFTVPVA